ncbi:MAG: GAF domain-containing protein [Polyangiales bacterium]
MTAPTDDAGVVPTIHARGAERLDAVVDLVHALARPRPLTELLDEAPRRVARVFRSEVCSLYLREGDGLVMRGNVGFVAKALGEVRLHVGEGLVGMAVECMRPVSADAAPAHERFRGFSMLGEERFPSFLAVPVPGPSGPAGALVVQRAAGAYGPHDVELLMALAGAIAPLVERARIVPAAAAPPTHAAGTRRVTIPGRSLVPGRALGMLTAAHRPPQRPPAEPKATAKEHARALERALHACEATIDMHLRASQRRGAEAAFLREYQVMLGDGRLRERVAELSPSKGLGGALAQVAREATRAARITDDRVVAERAVEMSELCDALRVIAAPEGAPRGAVWVAEAVTVFELLVAARQRPAGLVISGAVPPGRARTLVELIGVPAVGEVAGIFNWAGDGDVALVDGDHGLVRVNPPRRERDAARVERDAPSDDGGR